MNASTKFFDFWREDKQVQTLWFSDEKVFTAAIPSTNLQNNNIYSSAAKTTLIPTSCLISERAHLTALT